MLEDLNDAAGLPYFQVLDDFLLKVSGAYLFNIGSLLYLLALIEVLQFAIEELLYQLVKILSNLVKKDNLSVFVHIRILASLPALIFSTDQTLR